MTQTAGCHGNWNVQIHDYGSSPTVYDMGCIARGVSIEAWHADARGCTQGRKLCCPPHPLKDVVGGKYLAVAWKLVWSIWWNTLVLLWVSEVVQLWASRHFSFWRTWQLPCLGTNCDQPHSQVVGQATLLTKLTSAHSVIWYGELHKYAEKYRYVMLKWYNNT